MSFPFNVYTAAFVAALVTSAVTLPAWWRWCVRTGHVDDPGHRKIHDRPIALAGGLAVLTGMVLPLAVGWLLLATGVLGGRSGEGWAGWMAPLWSHGFGRRGLELGALGLGAVGMVALGWLDDRYELRPGSKFLGQAALAGLVAASGVRITLFVDQPLFSYAITVLWLLTMINACNFLDNMNGLCAGLGFIGLWAFGWNAAVHGQYLVTAAAFLSCGALLGFLPYNFPRARAFLGDAGSHLVGYLLGVLAILPTFYAPGQGHRWAVLKPLLILGVFLGDLVWVVMLRWRLGRPIYVGDTNHVSHRLVRRGLSRTRAVLVLWLGGAALAWLASWG